MILLIIFIYEIYEVKYQLRLERIFIGVSYSDPYTYEEVNAIVQIAQRDINKYCRSNNIKYRFKFIIEYLPFVDKAEVNLIKYFKSKKNTLLWDMIIRINVKMF
jgi:hypothetical protein